MDRELEPLTYDSPNAMVRISLILKGTSVEQLRALEKLYGITNQTELIRKSLARMYWMELKLAKGYKLILRAPDGSEETLGIMP